MPLWGFTGTIFAIRKVGSTIFAIRKVGSEPSNGNSVYFDNRDSRSGLICHL